jgi:hypothetical protein
MIKTGILIVGAVTTCLVMGKYFKTCNHQIFVAMYKKVMIINMLKNILVMFLYKMHMEQEIVYLVI